MANKTYDIKPCPKCGSENCAVKRHVQPFTTALNKKIKYTITFAVFCRNCGATSAEAICTEKGSAKLAEELAIIAWDDGVTLDLSKYYSGIDWEAEK